MGAPLALFALGYNLAHHNGLLGAAGAGRGTRLADWIDLLTPFAVIGPLLWLLARLAPGRRAWAVAAGGAIVYVEGHGIHLAANSIGNAATGVPLGAAVGTVHLWDEVVGHYLWFAGLAVVLAVCGTAARGRALGVRPAALAAGGAVSGLTWATNGLEGGTAVLSLLCALAGLGLVDRRGSGLSAAVLAGGAVAVAVIAGYGIAHGGFPQPSSL